LAGYSLTVAGTGFYDWLFGSWSIRLGVPSACAAGSNWTAGTADLSNSAFMAAGEMLGSFATV
jgi:hypothetical protein